MKKIFLFLVAMSFVLPNSSFGSDEGIPIQVENVKTVAGDQNISISWDRIEGPSIAGYKLYYGTSSVQKSTDFYDYDIELSADIDSYVIGVINGVPYYIALKAFNNEGLESEKYSAEKMVVPMIEQEKVEEPKTGNYRDPFAIEGIDETVKVIEDQPEKEVIQNELEEEKEFFSAAPAPIRNGVENLTVDSSLLKTKELVTLRWTLLANVFDQILYVKKGKQDWDNGYSVGKDVDLIELSVDMNEKYATKIVVVENDGSKLEGETVLFSTYLLPKSGAAQVVIGVTLVMIFGLFFFFFNRRESF